MRKDEVRGRKVVERFGQDENGDDGIEGIDRGKGDEGRGKESGIGRLKDRVDR